MAHIGLYESKSVGLYCVAYQVTTSVNEYVGKSDECQVKYFHPYIISHALRMQVFQSLALNMLNTETEICDSSTNEKYLYRLTGKHGEGVRKLHSMNQSRILREVQDDLDRYTLAKSRVAECIN
ncbi:uncharacterized protein UV8b_07915 [Ustilaginoidea virens]|uniref:Uncharacterized protein n=1 Tax=Ustilaginoidea virens TaxID=1159556 RepID=A0A8E5HXW9_USTVR|nr:uncharacterized protein UV8b_07915 [Ustilaginoidea virens]QUC23674.1 hypothetical protein UV8b_07915 [Ustilaginoidea virens]